MLRTPEERAEIDKLYEAMKRSWQAVHDRMRAVEAVRFIPSHPIGNLSGDAWWHAVICDAKELVQLAAGRHVEEVTAAFDPAKELRCKQLLETLMNRRREAEGATAHCGWIPTDPENLDEPTIQAVRRGIPDWDGSNWDAVIAYLNNSNGIPLDARLTVLQVRMLFATRQIRVQAHTTTGQVWTVGFDDPPAGSGEALGATHSEDFVFVNWFGTEYEFSLGVQSTAVGVLWKEWENSGLGLHQETIRQAVDCERDSFRMDKAFRNHPALGAMIQPCGDGRYRLVPPTSDKAARRKKSARIPSKAPLKPV